MSKVKLLLTIVALAQIITIIAVVVSCHRFCVGLSVRSYQKNTPRMKVDVALKHFVGLPQALDNNEMLISWARASYRHSEYRSFNVQL